MIAREQVADLRVGDVVEMRHSGWPAGSVARGPVYSRSEAIRCCGIPVDTSDSCWDLTVISRAPRPLYVNHDRTEPVPGDVVRQEGGCPSGHTWHYLGDDAKRRWWRFDDTSVPFSGDFPLRLLVDGETGQVVP